MVDIAQGKQDKKPDLYASFRLLRSNLGDFKGPMLLATLAATLSVGFELFPVWVVFTLIEMLVAGGANTGDFIRYAGLTALVIPIGYALFGYATLKSHQVAFHIIYNLRKRLARHLTELPLGYFSTKRSGAIRRLMIDEPERLELVIAHAIPEGTSALISWIAVSVWLFLVDWRMALAAIVLTPIAFLFMGLALGISMKSMQDFQKTNAHLGGAIGEFLAGISTIKVFQETGRDQSEVAAASQHVAASQSAMGRRFVPLGGTFYALILANVVVILPVGLWLMSAGSLSLPELLFFVVLGGNYSTPLMRLFNIFHQFAHISIAATQIQTTLDLPPQTDTGAHLLLEDSDVVFQDVRFSYGQDEVIKAVSFTAKTGTTTALVGPSGSGKSTIAHLIARFYDIPAGQISIGGHDISQMGRDQLMATVSFVFQDTFLFSGTIAENLLFARPEASEEQMHTAARAAHAHDFIMALEHGYDSEIGDGTGALSGGERQRIAIARAILKDAQIIVLDEATAFADPDSEAEIQKAISALAAGKTLIVVAHRLHTIASAEQIVVLDKGQIAERGCHSDLVDQGGLYGRMWTDHIAVRTRDLRKGNSMEDLG